MASNKVSELDSVLTVQSAEFYCVVSGESKKIAAEDLIHNPFYIHLGKSTQQDHGGANGSTTVVDWEVLHHKGPGFDHSTSVNPSRINFGFTGRVKVEGVVGVEQGGTARTTLRSGFQENGGSIDYRSTTRNYSRGAAYGNLSVEYGFELNVVSGEYIELITEVEDSDAAYTSYSIVDECDLVIRRI